MQISQESTCVGVFFNKVVGPQNCNFIKKSLQHRFFPVKFAKFLRTPCFTEHLQWLLLTVWGLQPATLLKMFIKDIKDVWLRQRWFLVNFAKILRTSFLLTERLRITASCVYQWILRSFPEHFFYRAPFSTTRYSKKLFHRCFLSILYKNEKYPFEGVHLLKIPENCLWRS